MKKLTVFLVCLLSCTLVFSNAATAAKKKKSRSTTPCKLILTSSEKQDIVNWVNRASQSDLEGANISASSVKKLVEGGIRPFDNFDRFWSTSGISATVVLNIGKVLDIVKYLEDRKAGKTPIRLRDTDKQKIVSYVNRASSSELTSIGVSKTALASILANRPFSNFKKLWVTKSITDSNLKKIGIACDAIKWVSGSTKLEMVSGIGASYAARLRDSNLYTLQGLIMSARYDEWREDIAKKISNADVRMVKGLILRWIRIGHLMRFKSCKEQWAELVYECDVKTSADMAQQNATALLEKMKAVNVQKNLCQTMPSVNYINTWIAQAATPDYADIIE